MEKAIEVTDGNLKETLSKNTVVVVDCWAPWCGPCKMMGPVIEELAGDFEGKIVFGKLNVDNNPKTSVEFGIRSIPTLLVFKDGKEADRIVGFGPKESMAAKFEKYL